MDACLLLERCKQGVVCFDPSGIITYANSAACGIFKRAGSEVCGKCIEDLLLPFFSAGAYLRGAQLHLANLLQEGGGRTSGKACVASPEGVGTPIEYRLASAKLCEGGDGYVMTCQDISERVETETRLAHLAHHDPLTDLPNRRLLSERLEYEIARARRYGDTFALHLIDLDDFKSVNDRYGHPVGDQLLMRLADRMKATVRGSDTIARTGGDEFAVIQVAVEAQGDVAALARKLLAECQRPVHLNGYELFPSVTIGVSFFAGDQSEEGLWLQADAALYKAKAQGKSTFVVVDEVITQSIKCNAQMVFALEHAVDYQQFRLVYQPQFCVNSGALIGLEALLRWQHPDLGDVGPATFIPMAEQHGFIQQIGLWVVREVCRQIRCWLDSGIPFGRVAINVSPLQLSNKSHIDSLVAAVDGAGIPWATLELEITETAYFAASRDVLQVLGSLQHRGARIAIDDFGTGYSSLLALLRMKADTLKIDKAFIDELHNAEAAGVVKETIALAHMLGMVALAEGVETPSQLALLEQFGCDRSQGFYLGLPSEVADLESQFFAISGRSSARHGHPISEYGENCEPDLIQWSAGFETGIAQIDLQHQKLVEMINRIAREAQGVDGGTSPNMAKVLDEIAHYVNYHFRCEEAFMERLHVVDHHTCAHREHHVSGFEKMQNWIDLFHAGRLQLEDLCSNLTQWLSYHMLAEDKILGEQLVAINRGTTPAEAYRKSMITAALECR